jgi:hypothetical protein
MARPPMGLFYHRRFFFYVAAYRWYGIFNLFMACYGTTEADTVLFPLFFEKAFIFSGVFGIITK